MGWIEDMTPGTTLTAQARQALSDHQRHVLIRAARVVHLSGTASAGNIRHGLARCRDHVRRGNVRSLRGLTGDALLAEIARTPSYSLSTTDRVERCLGNYRRRIAALAHSHRLRPGCRPRTQFERLSDRYKPGAALDHARMWLYAR